MRYESLPPEIQAENDALAFLFFGNDKFQDWETFREKYASNAFKEFFRKQYELEAKLYAQGIIEE